MVTVRARDLASEFPTVGLDTPATEAARLLAGASHRPGLVVVDANGSPFTILSGPQVLRMAVPRYCQDDPALCRVVDEATADVFIAELGERTVAQCLPGRPHELAVVDPDATVLEIAGLMARTDVPLVAVVADDNMIGTVTLEALLDRMLAT